jgi:hypothetical protein
MVVLSSRISIISRGRGFDAFLSISQLLVCMVCYALLILLYYRPQSYHLQALIVAKSEHWWSIKPTAAVPFFTTILLAATSSLITRNVENASWRKLSPASRGKHPTVGESRHLAEWTVSPWGRLKYFIGSTFLLRFAGVFLLATGVVSSTLGFGIGTNTVWHVAQKNLSSIVDNWSGFIDQSNLGYNGGDYRDNLHTIAAIGSMSNLGVPESNLCGPQENCTLSARPTAIIAECQSPQTPNTQSSGLFSNFDPRNDTYCSSWNSQLCVQLASGNVVTFANFTSGWSELCESNPLDPQC